MPIVRRWWQKRGGQIILGISSLALAWFLYQTRGAMINELLYYLGRNFQRLPEAEEKALLSDRRFEELSAKVKELEAENARLKKLLGYVEKQQRKSISAPVIGRSVDGWWQLVTIAIGTKEGVKKDAVVTGIGGLVGRVVEVTPNTSQVLLISDPSSRVGATITRTRYMGFIRGNSSQLATMEFYAKVSDVKVGDVVTTSTVSTIFPAGIPIGKVVSVNLNKSPAPEATIEFIAPLDLLEWVTVELTMNNQQ